jgi:uncharacterized protein (TIGR00251 family)
MSNCYRLVPDGVVISVRLTPKSSRDALAGLSELADGRSVLQARVRAVPDKGAANEALLLLMADAFRVPKSSVTIIAGATTRLKQIHISGEPERLAAVISRRMNESD